MMSDVLKDIEKTMGNEAITLNIGIDTGKGFTKSFYEKRGEDGKKFGVTNKFPSAIGIPNANRTYDKVHPLSVSFLKEDFYVGIPELCPITPTEDNEKNGEGNTKGESYNHDGEIVSLCACRAICDALKGIGERRANVNVAIGMPISEYNLKKDKREYFETFLPIGTPISCTYDGVRYDFTVRNWKVCPETFAAFSSDNYKDYGNLVLVDIGGNNRQYIVFADGRVNTDSTKTMTDKGGVNKLVKRIYDEAVTQQLEPAPRSLTEVQSWMLNIKNISFKPSEMFLRKFNNIVSTEKAKYLNQINDAIFNPVTGRFKDEVARGYKIIYTGGGSVLLKDEIKAL